MDSSGVVDYVKCMHAVDQMDSMGVVKLRGDHACIRLNGLDRCRRLRENHDSITCI